MGVAAVEASQAATADRDVFGTRSRGVDVSGAGGRGGARAGTVGGRSWVVSGDP